MSDPLLDPTALLPLNDPGGGLRAHTRHEAGRLRPFVATLAVPSKMDDKKHDTTATKNTWRTNEVTINDGTRSNDSTVDTAVDD